MKLITFDITDEQPIVTFQDVGVPGPRGERFKYEDFTPEQLESIRGHRGAPGTFKYDDLPPNEQVQLREEVAKELQRDLVKPNIPTPFGGYFSANAAAGIIKIKLPLNTLAGIIGFTVNITSSNYSAEQLRITGTFPDSGTWTKGEAIEVVGEGTMRVRFGLDGQNLVVYLGDTGDTFQNPTVAISEVVVGGVNPDVALWGTGWDISYINVDPTTTTFDTTAKRPMPSLTPQDIGALPAQGTSTDSKALNGFEPDTQVTPETVVVRDANGNVSARSITTIRPSQAEIANAQASLAFRSNNTDDNELRFASKEAVLQWLGRVRDSTRLMGKTLDTIKTETRSGLVADTITVNGKRLTSSLEITAADVGLGQVADYSYTNSPLGTSVTLYATQAAANAAAKAPLLDEERKRKITIGTADPVPTGASEGDIYLQHT